MLFPNTIKPHTYIGLILILIVSQQGYSQINSPYSRYGIGDLYNARNVVNKGMGNLATPYYDYQSVNFINPASYSRLQAVTFDVGGELESRTIKDPNVANSYTSGNVTFNYVTLGVPLTKDKKGATNWGMALGLKPYSKMNYNVEEIGPIPGIDSAVTTYEGSGGLSQVFLGTGLRIKTFSIGANVSYNFGQLQTSTRRQFTSDTVNYFMGQYLTNVSFHKLRFEGGMQLDIKAGKNAVLRLAATGHLTEDLVASKDIFHQTITYSNSGGFDTIDIVSREKNIKGDIVLPYGYTLGLAYDKLGSWMIGAEWEQNNWDDYRFYGEKDQVGNASMFRIGGQFIPIGPAKNTANKKYFSRVTYRAGFYTGKDYIKVNGDQLPITGGSIGFGLPVRRWNSYSNQFTQINTSFEFGKRGKKDNPVTESYFKLNIGLCLSDIWFIKRRFD